MPHDLPARVLEAAVAAYLAAIAVAAVAVQWTFVAAARRWAAEGARR